MADISHGRGGRGNIAPDDTVYVDGEIVRAGAEGSHEDGPFSTGRGGLGNVGDAARPSMDRADRTIVPEAAVRPSADLGDYRATGRGGAGNVAKDVVPEDAPATSDKAESAKAPPAATANVGLADKLKNKLVGVFKK